MSIEDPGVGVNSSFGIGVIIMSVVFGVANISVGAVLLKRRKIKLVEMRSPVILCCSTLYGTFLFCVTTASFIYGKTPTMCNLLSYTYTFYLPVWALPYLLQLPTFVFTDQLNKLKVLRSQGDTNWRWRVRGLFSMKSKIWICFVAAVLQLAIFLAVKYSTTIPGGELGDGVEGDCFRTSVIIIAALLIFYIGCLSFFAFRIVFVKDPYYMKYEICVSTILFIPSIVSTLISAIAPQLYIGKYDYRWTPIGATAMGFICTSVFPMLISFDRIRNFLEIYPKHLKSLFGKKEEDQIELDMSPLLKELNEGVDIFHLFLETPALLNAFKQFCISNWSVENVIFYKEVQNFKNKYPGSLDDQRVEGAVHIVSEFIAFGAPLEVNIEYKMRVEILRNVKERRINESTFDVSAKHIYQVMKTDSFEKWQKSPEYRATIESILRNRKSSHTSSIDEKKSTEKLFSITLA
mgnify:CR=1 FL=1